MMIPQDRYYTKGHQWVKIDEAIVAVGVTEPILRKLSPLVSIDLPDKDEEMKAELPYGELEGLQETHQLYPPVEARVVDVHEELLWNLDKLAKDPYGKGWLLKIRVHDPQELKNLLSARAYREFCAQDLGEGFADE
jgi:glycine cleavage system H protein